MRLLHCTPGTVNIAGGVVLMLLSLYMPVSMAKKDHAKKDRGGSDDIKMAL